MSPVADYSWGGPQWSSRGKIANVVVGGGDVTKDTYLNNAVRILVGMHEQTGQRLLRGGVGCTAISLPQRWWRYTHILAVPSLAIAWTTASVFMLLLVWKRCPAPPSPVARPELEPPPTNCGISLEPARALKRGPHRHTLVRVCDLPAHAGCSHETGVVMPVPRALPCRADIWCQNLA